MCYFIYGTLILTFGVFCDDRLREYALSAADGHGGWALIALGWEMALWIWPLLVLVALASSALTFVISRLMLTQRRGLG